MADDRPWFLYVVRCSDGTLYTGISPDVEARVAKHNAGRGAKYTKTRRPVVLLAWRAYSGRGPATRAERAFKKQARSSKLASLKNDPTWTKP